jgi:hypothetical protein
MLNRVLGWLGAAMSLPPSSQDKSYLRLFSPANLAMISDWLSETGELYVDIYHPHSGGGSVAYFVRSMDELKTLIAKETWREIAVTVFRSQQFTLRGTADKDLLEKALNLIPDGQYYSIISLEDSKFPRFVSYLGGENSHEELKQEFADVLGEVVGIGQNPFDLPKLPELEDVFEVSILASNQFAIRKNQDSYAPFTENPKRYQWLIDLWKKV